ncbi:MAG: AI-2E family transporter [Actinomycetota bacterium]|nr:AI-2E family transporter [Actinomycetota bacterium]
MEQRPVPVKTILVTIGLVLACLGGIYLIFLLSHILTLLVIAAFFAVVLSPPVDFVRRRLRLSKGLSTTIVFLGLIALVVGMLYAFIRPLVDETRQFIDDFPEYVAEAREGKGPVGSLVKRYDLDRRIEENRDRVNEALRNNTDTAVRVVQRIFAGLVSFLTVLVLAVLMILYGPELLTSGLGILSPPKRARVRAVALDCGRAITGYVMGNLLISVVAGTVTFIALWVFGVPFRGVLALFVAFTDLIPLVGATLGAIPTIFVAFLHSTTAGIGMLIVYIVYQQFENHVLQVAIMSKTVHINQLVVLVSVLIGVELLGILGALLAIPVAGVLQVIVRDLWDNRTGRPKEEPTIGEDEVPVSEVIADEEGHGAGLPQQGFGALANGPAHVPPSAPPPVKAGAGVAPPPPVAPAPAVEPRTVVEEEPAVVPQPPVDTEGAVEAGDTGQPEREAEPTPAPPRS